MKDANTYILFPEIYLKILPIRLEFESSNRLAFCLAFSEHHKELFRQAFLLLHLPGSMTPK
jgi:hypothetical protein